MYVHLKIPVGELVVLTFKAHQNIIEVQKVYNFGLFNRPTILIKK